MPGLHRGRSRGNCGRMLQARGRATHLRRARADSLLEEVVNGVASAVIHVPAKRALRHALFLDALRQEISPSLQLESRLLQLLAGAPSRSQAHCLMQTAYIK